MLTASACHRFAERELTAKKFVKSRRGFTLANV